MNSSSSGLVRVSHGLHRLPEQVDDLAGLAAALLSVCPDETVLSGVTGARLHGLWLPTRLQREVELIVHPNAGAAARRSYSKRPELRARRQILAPDEVVELDGLPVTSPARTFVDLAAVLRGGDLMALGDSVLRSGTTTAELDEVVARARHRPGVIRARAMVPLLDARSRSRPESHMRWIVVDAGLPRPEVNVHVYDDAGQWACEPDLSYDDVRLAMEYNGGFHAEDDRMQRDITRTLDVEERGGWRVVTFGKRQVFGQQDAVAHRVRTLRRECALLRRLSGPIWR